MVNKAYSRFSKGQCILRDFLAIDRTVLANERTLLAYIRTALTIIIAGITFIKFFGSLIYTVIGWILVPIGAFILIIGVLRFRKFCSRIDEIRD